MLAVKLTVAKVMSAAPSYIFKSWAVAAPLVSNHIVPATAELGLELPELDEFIADKTSLMSDLTVGNDAFAML